MHWIGIGIIGLLGGFTSGLLGVGGGVLFVPLLIIFYRMDPHLAIGTSLLVIVPTALAGATRHFLGNSIDFRMVLFLAGFAVFGAWLGATLSLQLDSALLRKIFALFLFLLAFRLLTQS